MLPATLACVAAFLWAASPPASDPDSDADGLPDFQEVHKYFTDPHKADTDADGTPDGDPDERREYAYTVRAVMHVMKPINPATLTDDYQDGRVLEDHPTYARIEVILYPFNTCASAIGERRNWRQEYASDPALRPYLLPGPTTNFDEEMRRDLLAALKADGIDVDSLSDRAAALKVSRWLMSRMTVEDSFLTFAVEFEDGKPRLPEWKRQNTEHELKKRGRTLDQQWDHELLGAGMYRTRAMGSCTSSAIYLSTCYKAIGLPARTIIVTPVLDGNDESEHAMTPRLTNHRVRRIVERAAAEHRGMWASHTFTEVYIDGRWRRLNYTRLGQNILDDGGVGLMVHVHTFIDHADAGLSAWGRRNAGDRNDVCGYANPYSCVELSDQFGVHCTMPNPAADAPLMTMTISRLYWYDDPEKPEVVSMRLDPADAVGRLLVHVEEDEPMDRFGDCYKLIGKEFHLRAAGHPDVRAVATRGFWVDRDQGVREFYLQISPDELPRMAPGVEYRLVPPSPEKGKPRWVVKDGVTIVRK